MKVNPLANLTAPGPTGGAYSALPNLLVGFGGGAREEREGAVLNTLAPHADSLINVSYRTTLN